MRSQRSHTTSLDATRVSARAKCSNTIAASLSICSSVRNVSDAFLVFDLFWRNQYGRDRLATQQSDCRHACDRGWPPERHHQSRQVCDLEAARLRRTLLLAHSCFESCCSYFVRSALHSSALKIRIGRPMARFATSRGRGRTELFTINHESANRLYRLKKLLRLRS